jgi:hypothetical protein
MKTIGILSSFTTILIMTLIYVNHMHVGEVNHLRMQVQIERAVSNIFHVERY